MQSNLAFEPQYVNVYLLVSLHYNSGELAQVATALHLECVVLQPSHERVVTVCGVFDSLYSSDGKYTHTDRYI